MLTIDERIKMKNRRFRSNVDSEHSGFTLIEVMVTIFVLVVGLLGLYTTIVGVIQGDAHSRNLTTATTLAQDKVEALRNQSYASLSSGSDSSSIFTRTWTVSGDSPAVGLATVEVTVGWTWKGVAHDVKLKTIIGS
jgi:prepilin-type N-terminal cleavage/methylation domain-containing protein